MKKRLVSIISLIACLCFVFTFAFTSVSAAQQTPTPEDFESYTHGWIDSWFSGDKTSLDTFDAQYEQGGLAIEYDVEEDKYKEEVKDAGAFKEYGESSLTQDGDIITIKIATLCESKGVDFVFTYDMATSSVKWAADVEESIGELVVRALLNTLMGMGTVFAVLIFISFIIALFKVFSKMGKKKETVAPVETAPTAAIVDETVEDETDDDEITVAISAAIAAYEAEAGNDYEVPADGLYVRSIKKRGFAN